MRTFKYSCKFLDNQLDSNLVDTSDDGEVQIHEGLKTKIDTEVESFKDVIEEANFNVSVLDSIEMAFDKSTDMNISFNENERLLHLIASHKTKESTSQINSENCIKVKFNAEGHINVDRLYPIFNVIHNIFS